ncbi:MAG: hypothetical protein ACLUD1_02445 [Clostridia bacterium]
MKISFVLENVGLKKLLHMQKYKTLCKRYKINNLEETEGIIEKQRMIKTRRNKLIEKACKITDDCFNY